MISFAIFVNFLFAVVAHSKNAGESIIPENDWETPCIYGTCSWSIPALDNGSIVGPSGGVRIVSKFGS
jgi:hypothetical protein